MALEKQKELESEATGDYWRIDRVELTYDVNKSTTVWLGLYKSAAAFGRNKKPIYTQVFRWGGVVVDTRNDIYTKIKESAMVKVIDVPEIKNFVTGEIIQAEVSHMEETNWFVDAVDV
jgi:hypothetical protein